MTNAEKYKTSSERLLAYNAYAKESWDIGADPLEKFCWLEQEVFFEKALPCPFCGSTVTDVKCVQDGTTFLCCDNKACRYESPKVFGKEYAVRRHNIIALLALEKRGNK